MPGTFLGYPFDEELFYMQWQMEPDPIKLAMFNSGAIVENAAIRRMISNGSNYYTFPIYNILEGTPDNYNGVDNITMSEPTGMYQSGVVYGRAHSWKDRDFIHDFNSGANPTQQIVSQTARFWQKQRQKIILGILDGLFSVTAPTGADTATTAKYTDWEKHSTTITTEMEEATLGDAIQKAVGDNSDIISMVWMHSKVALGLAKKQLLKFRTYTDANGIQRELRIADWNGRTVIVDDDCPHTSATRFGRIARADEGGGTTITPTPTSGETYTTYAIGRGFFQHAPAPVKVPVEIGRNELTNGGYDFIVNRFRETYHPNGFSYVLPDSVISPTDAQLFASANWKIVMNPKTIPLVRIVSAG